MMKDCPKCQAVAYPLSPVKDAAPKLFACSACGHAFDASGRAYIDDVAELNDHFRGATLGKKTLVEMLAGEKLNPATKSLMTAQLLEYGTQMWFDGLKQGLLLGAMQLEKGDHGLEQADGPI